MLYLSVTISMINAMIKSCAKKEINLKFLEVSQESNVNIFKEKGNNHSDKHHFSKFEKKFVRNGMRPRSVNEISVSLFHGITNYKNINPLIT